MMCASLRRMVSYRGLAVLLGGGMLLQTTGCLAGLVPIAVSLGESFALDYILSLLLL